MHNLVKHLIVFLSPHSVGICLLCKIAVHPGDSLASHFRNLHKVKGQELHAIKTLCNHWGIQSPATVKLPEHGSPPIDVLPIHLGFQCCACAFLSRSEVAMRRHYREKHGERPELSGLKWRRISLQAFTLTSTAVRYWVVDHA